MARSLNDWLAGYLKYVENTEAPVAYHIWTALSIISGVLQRRCYIRWGHNLIYPNQYIVLVGPSGKSRKNDAIGMARFFFTRTQIPMAAQKSSKEKLVNRIASAQTSFTDEHGQLKFQNAISIVSGELHVLLGKQDTDFLAWLTDWYDSLEEWEYATKNSGTDFIPAICVNMLGATAPDWLPSMLTQEAVGGGWTSRVVFVVEEDKGKIIEDPNEYGVDKELEEQLISDLEEIKLLTGEYKFTKDGLEQYKHWYRKQENNIKNGKWPVTDPKFAGYISRRATHIKKVAMALSASRSADMVITEEDFNRAKKLLEVTEKKMPRAFRAVGKAKFAELTDMVLNYIIRRKRVKRSEILYHMQRDLDSWTMEQIERVLEQMKVIRRSVLTQDDDVEYIYIGTDDGKNEQQDFDDPRITRIR